MEFETAFRYADLAIQTVRDGEGLKDVERIVLEGSWHGQTYARIAEDNRYSPGYLSRDIGPTLWRDLSNALGARVGKNNFRNAVGRWAYQQNGSLSESASPAPLSNGAEVSSNDSPLQLPTLPASWGICRVEATGFHGREKDLATLKQWVLANQCRLVGLVGLPGIGKTWLLARLFNQLNQLRRQADLHRVVYRSLKDCPEPRTFLAELIVGLDLPLPSQSTVMALGQCLVDGLADKRYVLMLDDVDALLQPGAIAGTYQPHLQGHADWLEQVGKQRHRSCVICVGRELPQGYLAAAGELAQHHRLGHLPVPLLKQLAYGACQPQGNAYDWQRLHQHYGGIPDLTQRLVRQLYHLGQTLQTWQVQATSELPVLTRYLEDWLAPLSDAERTVLTAIALRNIPQPPEALQGITDGLAPNAVIGSLRHRGLCDFTTRGLPGLSLTGGTALRAYLCRTWVASFQLDGDHACLEDVEAQWLAQLHRYPLLDAHGSEQGQRWQRRHLLEPLAAALATAIPGGERLAWIQRSLARSRQWELQQPGGYSAGNLVNLAQQWQVPLTQLSLENLTLRGADLQGDRWQGVSLAGANLAQVHRAQPLGRSPQGAIAQNGETVVIGDQAGCLLVWQARGGMVQAGLPSDPPSPIGAVTLSADGTLLAEGRQDGQVNLWPLASGYGPETLWGTQGAAIQTLVLAPRGDWLLAGDAAGHVYRWQLASGQCTDWQSDHSQGMRALAISPCGHFAITGGRDGSATEWQVASGVERHHYRGRAWAWLGTVGYCLDTTETPIPMALGQDEGQISLWSIATGTTYQVLPDPPTGPVDSPMMAAVSPDGRYGAIGDIGGTVHLWDIAQGQWLVSNEVETPVTALAFSPQGQHLMVCQDHKVQVWQMPTGDRWRTWGEHYPLASALGVTATPAGTLTPQLLSGHPDRTLRCWQQGPVSTWRPTARLSVPGQGLLRTVVTGAQQRFWVVGDEQALYLWEHATQAWCPRNLSLGHPPTALVLDPTETWLACGDSEGCLSLWHLPTQRREWIEPAHDRPISALSFSPDGTVIACGSHDRTISGWDLQRQEQWRLEGHHDRPTHLCFDQTQRLWSGGRDGTVRCWNVATPTPVSYWEIPDQRMIYALTLDAQGDPLGVLGTEGCLEVWDLGQGQVRAELPTSAALWQALPSPDGCWLLTASHRGDLNLWDLITGQRHSYLRVDRPYEAMSIRGCTGLPPAERDLFYALGAVDR
jgi:WD40 repeat protein